MLRQYSTTLGRLDDLSILQDVLDLADAALDQALLFAGAIVLGILTEVTVIARIGNLLGNRAPSAFEFFELSLELRLPSRVMWYVFSWVFS